MTEQKEFVDFNVGLGDTGEDNLSAIQPISDGEGATQIQFRRPSENLRERTETLRDTVGELLYYRDYSHLMIEYTGGTITWNGPAPGASPLGKISITAGSFTIAPMLAPYQAKKGTLSVGTASSNQVIYTVAASSYATHGMNAVTVKHLNSTGVGSVSVTISAGPVKRIVVTLDTANTAHDAAAVQTALTTAIAADTDLASRITITTSAIATVPADAVAETRLDTTADDEKHVIAGSDIQALTVATPLQAGMGIAIWYKYLIEPAGFGSDPKAGLAGGRAESSGDRGTSAIPAAALFVTSSNPEKIPGAIPLCRVGYNGQLIWYDGTRLESGESFQFKSPTSVASTALAAFTASLSSVLGGALVGYNGSGFWADGVTSVTASTMEGAVDEVVSDLAAVTATSPGAIRIGVDAATIFSGALTAAGGGGALTSNATVRAALDQLDTAVVARRGYTAVCTNGTTSTGGDLNGVDLFTNINTLGAGRYCVRRGTYTNTVTLSAPSGVCIEGEYDGGVTLASPLNTSFTVSTTWPQRCSFENVDFTIPVNSTGEYRLGNGVHRLVNCSAYAGALRITPPADGCDIDIDGLRISTDIGGDHNNSLLIQDMSGSGQTVQGKIKDLRIDVVNVKNSAASAQYALRLKDLSTSGYVSDGALVFENAVIRVTAGFGVAGGAVVRIEDSKQPTIFRNCIIEANQSGATTTALSIFNSSDILFEDCKVYQQAAGAVLSVTGTDTHSIHFKRCKLYTSPTDIQADEILAYGSTDGVITFEDTYMEVRRGDASTTRRIELGSLAGVNKGSNIKIDGLTVKLNYSNTGYLNSGLFTLLTNADYTSVVAARNLIFDFQSKRLAAPNGYALYMDGFSGAALEVNGLYLLNVTEPDTAAGATTETCTLVQIGRGRVKGGAVTGTPTGTTPSAWKGIYYIFGSAGCVQDVVFWENAAPNKGRLIYGQSDRCKIQNNSVVVTDLAANEDITGWFCYIDQDQCTVHNNTISISGTVGSYVTDTDAHTLMYVSTTSDNNSIMGNTLRTAHDMVILTIDGGDYNTVIGNTIRCTSSVADVNVIKVVSGTRNVVVGNTAFNSGTFGVAIIDTATNTVVANNNVEP